MNGKTKYKKSSVHLTKTESFKRFVAVEKPKLKTLYPFLSADQINHKLKDKWNSLEHGTCKTTSVKSTRIPQKKSSNRNVSKPSKQTIDVNDTPQNINKNKLKEFREQHSKQYSCDFHDTGTYNVAKSSSQSWNQVQSYNRISRKGPVQKTLQLTEEPSITQPDIFEDRDKGNNVTIPIKEYEGFDSSMDSEDDAVLLRRSEVDVNNNMEKTDDADDAEKTDGTREVTDSVSAKNEEAQLDISIGGVFSSIQSRSDHNIENGNNNTTDIGYRNINDFGSPTNKDSEVIEVFKSPLVECLNSSNKQQKRGRRSAPAKLTTPDLLTNLKKTITPNVSGTCKQDNYTTPQMDEILQKLTIHEVKKAPHKRRHSCEGVDHLEKIKLVASSRRVRRSLRTQRPNLKENYENEESDMKHEDDIEGVSDIEKATNTTDKEINTKQERIQKEKGNINSDLYNNDIDNRTFEVNNNGELATVFGTEKATNKNDIKEIITKKVRKQRKKKGNQKMSDLNNTDFDETSFNSDVIDKPLADGKNIKPDLKDNTIQEYNVDNSIPVNPSGDASQNIMDIDSKTNEEADGCTEVDGLHRNVGRRITKRRHEMTLSGEDVEKIQTDSVKKRKAVGKSKIGDMGNVDISNSQKSHDSSIELGSSPPSSISSLRSLTPIGHLKSTSKLETTNPVLKKALRSLRSATVGTPAWSGSDGHTLSPCLLSPALSGISAFSSGSDPSVQESYSSSHSSNYADDENFMNENKMEVPSINQDAGQQGLGEMFKDVTPPECKTKGLYKTTRMLPSTAEGNSQTFFHEDNDEIF